MSDNKTVKCLVVGSGFTGLATALSFKKNKLDVVVVEAENGPSHIGGTITLFPNAMRILRVLGVADEIIKSGATINRVKFQNQKGKHIVYRSMGTIDQYGEPTVIIRRARLLNIFLDKVKKEGIEIFYSKKVVKVETLPENVHEVLCEDGTLYKSEYIIGADGINSSIRSYVLPEIVKPKYSGLLYIAGLVSNKDFIKSLNLELTTQYVAVGANSFFAYSICDNPENNNYSVLWFCCIDRKERLTRSDLDQLSEKHLVQMALEAHNDWGSPIKQLIGASDEFFKTSISDIVEIKNWSKGKIIIIGDAAHALNPISGQGAGMGIEDAYFLSMILDQNLFKEFEEIRKKRINKIGYKARRSSRFTLMKMTPFLQMIRNTMFSLLTKFTPETKLNWSFKYRPEKDLEDIKRNSFSNKDKNL